MDTTDLDLYKLSKQTDVNKYKVRFRTYPKKIPTFTEKLSQIRTRKEKQLNLQNISHFKKLKLISIKIICYHPVCL